MVHQRLAELWFKLNHEGELSEEEIQDFKHCLDANMHKAQKLARLYNLSLIASITNDTEWQHEICAEIEKIKESMQ